jgi:hypothetical protein
VLDEPAVTTGEHIAASRDFVEILKHLDWPALVRFPGANLDDGRPPLTASIVLPLPLVWSAKPHHGHST